ncbi:MAG: SlyX family protein [Simkaniaceae bacterium]|nr:SlyX family protein [Simkaniaceae bacterium]
MTKKRMEKALRNNVEKSVEKDIISLQELVSHQNEDIARLSDELFAQQKEVAQLKHDLAQLRNELVATKDRLESEFDISTEEQHPPHY